MAREASTPPITGRLLGQGEGWRASEFICRAGPTDPAFEERHEDFAIAAVLAGSFGYRAHAGRALLHPGAFLLGNAGGCYECGHEHGVGDRCAALQLSPALFEEIAASVAGGTRFRFAHAMLPALPATARAFVALEALAARAAPEALEETVLAVAEHVIATCAGHALPRDPCPPADERRITRALRHIEAHAEDPLDLAALAGIAGMSRYHFLRRFRCVTGQTPYRYVIGMRLRRAAFRLRGGGDAVSAIAYACGFGDLSTFNASFRATFGVPPLAWRRAG